jgi:cellobiose-specific phosphotransferase system component IIC
MVQFQILVLPLFAGILTGYALRKRWHVKLTKVMFATIIALIFSLGFSIGSNNDALTSLPRVGWSALFIAALTILFSIALVELARRKVKLT